MRQLTANEQKNVQALVNMGIEHTLVQITSTGYRKGILDATAPMREYFLEHGVHDYSKQLQGEGHKVPFPTYIYNENAHYKTSTSLYRPMTKKGDPRLWIYNIKAHCQPDDIIALISYDDNLHAINISSVDIQKALNSPLANPLNELLKNISSELGATARELFGLIQSLSGEWRKSEILADTGIGRTVESLLGIPMNSSRNPDYKGIELKSFREKRPNIRKNLFSKVPDWDISRLKSGAEIVKEYGYMSNGIRSYRNTLCCHKVTAQGIGLTLYQLDKLLAIEELEQRCASLVKLNDVAVWRLDGLHNALLTKHKETFWIEVESKKEDGNEYFRFSKIEHTRNPIVSQFDLLLDQGLITVDLLLGRSKRHGDTYSFKIAKQASPLLFPDCTVTKLPM